MSIKRIFLERLRALSVLGAILSVSLSGCAYQKAVLDPKLEAEIKTADAGKIPTKAFFEEAKFSGLRLSPDGKHIAAMFPEDGRTMLGILTGDMQKVVHVVKFEEEMHVRQFRWVNDERLMIWVGKKYGFLDGRVAQSRLYFVNLDGSKLKDFFSKEWAYYDLLNVTPDDPETIVMAKYHAKDRGRPIAIKLNVYNGRTSTLAIPPMRSGAILANDQGETDVAIGYDSEEDFDKIDVHVRGKDGWKLLAYPAKGEDNITPIYLDSKKQELYLVSGRETGKRGLYVMSLTTGKSKPIFAHEIVDVGNFLTEDGKIVGLVFENGRPETVILNQDSKLIQVFKQLQATFPDEMVAGLELTKDKKKGLFLTLSDKNPGTYYMVSLEDKIQVTELTRRMPDLPIEKMGTREPIHLLARDKTPLYGYVTLPFKKTLKDKLPMIVLPHGGPFGPRDSWTFDADAQFFASRGYAVLQVNFRGSGGYGLAFEEAGHRQWGKTMQDDVTDATKWAIAQGIADAQRICIYGASYGGYASLMGVAKEPDLYKCAISYVGVSDLTIKYDEGDVPQSKAGRKFIEKTLGPKDEDRKALSPAYLADKIKVPVFIVHGEDDQRVPIAHANNMRKALETAGKPYKWLVKPSEGHGFQQLPNRLEGYHRMLEFIEAAIGKGDATPVAHH